jgi:hypothetical protein
MFRRRSRPNGQLAAAELCLLKPRKVGSRSTGPGSLTLNPANPAGWQNAAVEIGADQGLGEQSPSAGGGKPQSWGPSSPFSLQAADESHLPAFHELRAGLRGLTRVRRLLRERWLGCEMAQWLRETVESRRAKSAIPQGAALVSDGDGAPIQGVLGSLDWRTAGLGLTAMAGG